VSADPSRADGAGAVDWDALGIAPTGDAAALRAAYRARLREVGPDRDPEGFQRLRAAYEAALALPGPAAGSSAGSLGGSPGGSPGGSADAGAAARAAVAELDAHRAAGDPAGAIRALDAALDAHPPGSAAAEAIEDLVLAEVALTRALSPELFRHLVGRFDWRDAGGRAARADPERHAVLLDRLAAEDWLEALRRDAAAPGGGPDAPFAAALLAPHGRAGAMLPPGGPNGGPNGGLDAAGRARLRALLDALRGHGRFVLHRFDGATLALLREAAEGPPLLGDTRLDDGDAGASATGRRRWGWSFAVTTLGIVSAGAIARAFLNNRSDTAGTSGGAPGAAPDARTAVAAARARADLAIPTLSWVELSPAPGGILVDFAPLLARRAAITEIHYGTDAEEPGSVLSTPAEGVPLRFVAGPETSLVTVRVRFRDGTLSAVRRYPLRGAAGGPAGRSAGGSAGGAGKPPPATEGKAR